MNNGNQGQQEYVLAAAPCADPDGLKLAFQGADDIKVKPAGKLVLHIVPSELSIHKLVPYQKINLASKHVKNSYVHEDDQPADVEEITYAAARPLVIDQALLYSISVSGSYYTDTSIGIAVDQWGQTYVTRDTHSFDFPTANASQNTNVGNHFCAFVAKIGSDNWPCGHDQTCTDENKHYAPGGRGKRTGRGSESMLSEHPSNIWQLGFEAFACQLAHYWVN